MSKIKRFAKLVSFLFDGSVLVLPILLSVFLTGQGRLVETLPSFFVSFGFLSLVPYLFIFYLYKSKKICDLHMSKRKERIIPLVFINISVLAGFIILRFIQSTKLMDTVYLSYLIVLLILSIITLFWKISFHTSYATIFSFVFIAVYGKWALFSIILILLMIWARVELKKHTITQAVSGVIVTALLSTVVFNFNGFTTTSHPQFVEIAGVFTPLFVHLNLNMFLNKTNMIFIILLVFLLLAYKVRLTKRIN